MAEAAERVRAAAEQRGVEVELEEPDPPVAVLGDRRQLTSAVYNLLENAVKFSYESTAVTCAGHLDGDGEVVVEVTDKVVGIPARDLPNGSSSASTGWTTGEAARPEGPASDWPSSAMWRPITAAASTWSPAKARARPSPLRPAAPRPRAKRDR